jgi:hypothetical protein
MDVQLYYLPGSKPVCYPRDKSFRASRPQCAKTMLCMENQTIYGQAVIIQQRIRLSGVMAQEARTWERLCRTQTFMM